MLIWRTHVGTDKQTAVSDSSVDAEVLFIWMEVFTHLKMCHHQYQLWDHVCATLTGKKKLRVIFVLSKKRKRLFLDATTNCHSMRIDYVHANVTEHAIRAKMPSLDRS